MDVAYQGIAGAFSEAAVAALFPGATPRPAATFAELFDAIGSSDVRAAVVPVENSYAGSVVDVYDLLRQSENARIVAELALSVRQSLLGVRGARLEDVVTARSHPQALAQAETFLRTRGIRAEAAYDTAGAAADVARAGDRRIAAVASRRAAARYGLDVLADGIETSPDNVTRFFALAREDDAAVAAAIPATLRDGPPKTSLVFTTQNRPGGLVRALQPFATADVQLTKIESRPSRAARWEYVFYLDFEGDPERSPAREALALMRTCCEWISVLGTYPAATRVVDPDEVP